MESMGLGTRSARLGRSTLAAALTVALLLCAICATASFAAVKPLKIKPETLKTATATEAYSQTLGASGGTAPYTFTIESGSPPEGISLSPSGELAGTAASAGTSTFTVLVTDSTVPARTTAKTYTLPVQLDVLPKSLGKGEAGEPYSRLLSAAGGTGPYEFTLASGELPEYVELYSEPGFDALNGFTEYARTYVFAIQAKDEATGATGTRTYKLKVGLGISPHSGELQVGHVGASYFGTANLVGGSGTYTYAITSGALPDGLVLGQEQTSATFSGTPQKAEKAKFTVTGTDTETGVTRSAKYHLTVRAIRFPGALVELEERDKEGNFRGRDEVGFEITREAKGRVYGTMYDGDGSTGAWTYDLAANSISFKWPEGTGGEVMIYSATCSQAAEECSGTQSTGTFTLRPAGS
jgi:hypothetical protein